MSARTKSKRCILIADDDPDVLGLLAEALFLDGFEVLRAGDGKEALRIARNYKGEIALLITDVQMPLTDGFDLQERLLQERPETKLLVISGALPRTVKGRDFPLLKKPFTPAQLRETVNQILG
jgi:two-component system cell cycle sensor histidine kinase/response regulator CckA